MLRTRKELEHYHIAATDGDIGKVGDFYFDDQSWVIRYLVVDTSRFWEAHNGIAIPPMEFRAVDGDTQKFHLALSRAEIKNSNWTPWQDGSDLTYHFAEDPHLRSLNEMTGYEVKRGVEAADDELGKVAGFLIDDETWTIRYVVLDASTWGFPKNVLLAPHWAREIRWMQRTIYTDITREMIAESPEWNPDGFIQREYEARLYDHYGQRAYWIDGPAFMGSAADGSFEVSATEKTTCPHCGHPRHTSAPCRICTNCSAEIDWQKSTDAMAR